jgi:membrane protease YdiL (CAAX protease family)
LRPNYFLIGISFTMPAGFVEEIAWMAYAFPKMNRHHSLLTLGILLGRLWGAWHLPVVEHLGALLCTVRFGSAVFLALQRP